MAAELIEDNPRYAYIWLQNGDETMVSLRDPANAGLVQNYSPEIQDSVLLIQNSETLELIRKISTPNEKVTITVIRVKEIVTPLCRSKG